MKILCIDLKTLKKNCTKILTWKHHASFKNSLNRHLCIKKDTWMIVMHPKLKISIWRFFAFHFIHKLNIQLLHEIGFCLTCSCQHPMVLTIQHEDQMANFYSKKSTSKLLVWNLTIKKGCEDSNNKKNSFSFHLANWDSKNLLCKYSHSWELLLFCWPPH